MIDFLPSLLLTILLINKSKHWSTLELSISFSISVIEYCINITANIFELQK